MFEKILEFRKSPAYDIINSLKKDIIGALIDFGKNGIGAIKKAIESIDNLTQRRSEMKINVISKEELEDFIDIDKLKDLADKVSGIEKYIPSIAALSAIPSLSKKSDDVVVVEKKSSPWKVVVIVLLVCAAVGGIAFAIYKYFKSDYDDDFFDDIDDEFDDEDDDAEEKSEELFEE